MNDQKDNYEKKILFTIKLKKKTRINLTKEVKDLYTKNYDIDEKNWTRHK